MNPGELYEPLAGSGAAMAAGSRPQRTAARKKIVLLEDSEDSEGNS